MGLKRAPIPESGGCSDIFTCKGEPWEFAAYKFNLLERRIKFVGSPGKGKSFATLGVFIEYI